MNVTVCIFMLQKHITFLQIWPISKKPCSEFWQCSNVWVKIDSVVAGHKGLPGPKTQWPSISRWALFLNGFSWRHSIDLLLLSGELRSHLLGLSCLGNCYPYFETPERSCEATTLVFSMASANILRTHFAHTSDNQGTAVNCRYYYDSFEHLYTVLPELIF